ncbi:phosphocholine-specific phospholipase C [Streptomyces sp. ISL-11]|uniref:phosphocholine-specific phospholipase C n=1 Tax=Streptomyces sp. ISL-11 TaxID=2819174 RepID=UPI001BEB332F|nr:phospholipase C, phosphocholine-specific [Streptomyces sp. ISL-11]MBT2385359.1 phospholipase C, phosphocholine-specific [Streptomyces sp. ISL-11]
MSRRRALALGAGGAAALAAGSSLLPPSLQRVIAADAGRGGRQGLDEIRHVVILMQENRSFDHYFGTLRGVRGFGDRNAVRLPGGGTVFRQPGPSGPVLPFGVRDAAAAQHRDLQYIGALDHSWDGGAKAWRDGWMDGWTAAKSPATMAHYDRADVPLHFELADTFTVCDAYHSSIHSSTSPNRNHLFSGWTGFEPGAGGKRAVGNDAYAEDTHPGYTWTTYAERLQKAGVGWQVYQEWDNFTDNNLEFFASFKAVARKALARIDGVRTMTAFYEKAAAADAPARERLLALLDEGVAALTDADRTLFRRALRRGEPGSLATAFAADVAAGTLPQVSYLVPSAADSEHPGSSSPVASASLVYRILDALGRNPEVWRHTALFITYDENDGFFDHVPPPVPPPGTEGEFWQGRPVGLGIRVPMLVVSPWSLGGYVCSEVFDHTSVIRFLERRLGVREPNISAWRRTVCGDLTGAFDFTRGRRLPPVERPGAVPPFTGRWSPRPPAEQRMPRQEPGTRPTRPLPYRPDADGGLDGELFRLRLRNAGRSSAHFALYPYAGEYGTPQHRDVLGSASWDVPVRKGAYDFVLTGPGGFRRECAGTARGAAAGLHLATRLDAARRELHLTLANRGPVPLTVTLSVHGYGTGRPRTVTLAPGATRTLPHAAGGADGWYDLVIGVAEDRSFARRLMGHIENGRESVTG